ncbi:MAG: hypothetical protein GY847_08755 [Proteobacteria bacterium]|nr:hypothetical protein [Pseudomonadota bacterium]
MRRIIQKSSFLLVAFIFLSCDTDGLYDKSINVEKTMTLQNGVAIYENGMGRIVYLAASPSRATLEEIYRVDENEQLLWFETGPDPDNPSEVFAMSVPVDERDADHTETLQRIHADGTVNSYIVNSVFNELAFGPYQKYAILYHGSGSESEGGLYNPNEVALIDLSSNPGNNNPSTMSIDLDGRRVTGVSFLPTLSIGGIDRQFAVFLSEGGLRLIDLLHPDSSAARIPLTDKTDPRNVTPVQVFAREKDEIRDAMIFVRANGSEDIYAISLTANNEGVSDFTAAINQIEAGGTPQDMALVQDGTKLLLAVLSSNSGRMIVNIIDIDTSAAFSIEVDDSVTTAMLREGNESEEIVLYGNNSKGVHFLRAKGLTKEKGHNLDHVFIPDQVQHAIRLDGDRLLIIPHRNRDLILFDLNTRDSTRLTSPWDADWDDARTQIYKNQFFCVPQNSDRINVVDLDTGHPDSLLLDDAVQHFHILKGSGTGVVMHDTPSGRVTVFPLNDPTRGKAYVLDGLWLGNFLDETEVTK